MAEVDQGCSRNASADDCGTLAVAAIALEALLPSLSAGLIQEHAAFFVANCTARLSAMPFFKLSRPPSAGRLSARSHAARTHDRGTKQF
jgi:hypothetical protein